MAGWLAGLVYPHKDQHSKTAGAREQDPPYGDDPETLRETERPPGVESLCDTKLAVRSLAAYMEVKNCWSI